MRKVGFRDYITPGWALSRVQEKLKFLPIFAIFVSLVFTFGYLFSMSKQYYASTLQTNPGFIKNTSGELVIEQPQEKIEPWNPIKQIIVSRGDNFEGILRSENIESSEIRGIIAVAKKHKLGTRLKIGQKILLHYARASDDSAPYLEKVSFVKDKTGSLDIHKRKDDAKKFAFSKNQVKFEKYVAKISGIIEDNFISSLRTLGLPRGLIHVIINAYSTKVDFARQVRRGDRLSIVAEKFFTEDGKFSHYGKILYATLNLSGKDYEIFHYNSNGKGGKAEFFSASGESLKGNKKFIMPVKHVRITDKYGMRKRHPVLGVPKMHHGVDFGGRVGTPILAMASGVVTKMRWIGAYGRSIEVKHDKNTSTFYAHASRYAKGIKVGSKVSQGQVIAYIGRTGRVSGPHLHCEVKIKGKRVDPLSIKMTPKIILSGKQLSNFKSYKREILALSDSLTRDTMLARGN